MKRNAFMEFCTGMQNGTATRVAKNLANPSTIRNINILKIRSSSLVSGVPLSAWFDHAHCLDRVVESDGDLEL